MEEVERKMKDELDDEVDKAYEQHMSEKKNSHMSQKIEEDDEDYS
jgi:hypothetical protein